MPRYLFSIVSVVVTTLAPLSAIATEPCHPDTWFAKRDRPATEWATLATWMVVGKVTAREEKIEPALGCSMADRTQCAREDNSVVTVRITHVDKGPHRKGTDMMLRSAWCGPPPPKETGGTYRFYGNEAGAFLYFAKP